MQHQINLKEDLEEKIYANIGETVVEKSENKENVSVVFNSRT